VSADRAASFRAIYPEARFEDELPQIEAEVARSEAVFALITGWMQHSGPVTAALLASLLKVPLNEVDQALLRIEATGSILRGKFEGFGQGLVEWCERRLLARIHRLTLGALRKQIEPVPPATYMRWLFRWQHLAPMSQTAGEHGLLEVLRQLQGFEIPANAWERHVLARRVANYNPEHLDRLSLTGAIGWGRLSPHPATLEASSTGVRRVVPTSVAPITFYVREDADWMMPHHERKDATASKELERSLSEAARSVHTFLTTRGASFFADVVRGTGKLKAEVETGLWELVAAGLVTADGFDNLRALIDPRRRTGRGSQRSARPRHSAGRWSLLYTDSGVARERQIEATCRMLLKRYGIVFRELLVRESVLPKWRELLIAFRRLEDRGEIRGGRFVSGFLGEQFALPEAVESLRELRKIPPRGEEIAVSAADPLNLVGIVVPGDRVPAIFGRFVNFRDGVALEGDAAAPVVPIAQAEESVG
jgi:ATP-dependent Lhr-like helicase